MNKPTRNSCDECFNRQGTTCAITFRTSYTSDAFFVYCQFPVLKPCLWFIGTVNLHSDPSSFTDSMFIIIFRMCDILQHRQTKLWLRPDWLFSLTSYGKEQMNLLGIIHGLTKKVNAACLCIFTKQISLIVY